MSITHFSVIFFLPVKKAKKVFDVCWLEVRGEVDLDGICGGLSAEKQEIA
jgi:hypothetical protein